MPMTERDRERFRRQCESLREFENDELIEGEALHELVRQVNRSRAARGLPLLEEYDPDAVPEQGFYDRAKSLGMARIRR